LIPFSIIEAANSGDAIAIQYILKHYEGYIVTLATKTLTDEYSNGYFFVDKEMQEQLTTALLQMILDFEI
jgi:hypothetical protein